MTDLDHILATRTGELGVMAASWLGEGARAVELWGQNGLAARWAPDLELGPGSVRQRPSRSRMERSGTPRFPRSSGSHVPVSAAGRELGWLRLVGMRGSVTRRRLLADAAMIAGLVEHEHDLDTLTDALIESQDNLLGLVSMLRAAGPDDGNLHSGLASRARELLRAGPVALLTQSGDGWRIDTDAVAEGRALKAQLARRRLGLSDLRRELEADWLVSTAPERLGVPLLLLIRRDPAQPASSPLIRLAAAVAELSATLIGQADRHSETLERERLERQMAFAGEVQRHLLPASTLRPRGMRIATHYKPADAVGGDIVCVRSRGSQTLLALGDVSGKGAPAALLMAAARALFESHARTMTEPAALLASVTRDLAADLERNSAFMTFCVARHDASTGELCIANAGHAPVLLRSDSTVTLLEPGDPPVGVLDDFTFNQVSLRMVAGDTLVMASDGLSEREDPDGRQFGIDRISEIVGTTDGPPRRLVDRLVRAARHFAGGRAAMDDETLLVAQPRASAAA